MPMEKQSAEQQLKVEREITANLTWAVEQATADAARLRDALQTVLASLVATTSLIIRAEDEKKQPSNVVASDKMFRQMLEDYDAATIKARAALSRAPLTC